jgi:hypothetical protein
MLPTLLDLGPLPPKAKVLWWVAARLGQAVKPLLDDPQGALHRFGDAIVWKGHTGGKVLATLEGVADGQDRIRAA